MNHLKGRQIRIRFTIDDTGKSWDMFLPAGAPVQITDHAEGVANVEIIMSEGQFLQTQIGTLPQLEFLRLLNGKKKKFDLLENLKGQTTLLLALDNGPPLKTEFLFNMKPGERTARKVTAKMHYDDMRGIIEGRKNMKWLFITRRITYDGSLMLLSDSGTVLDPN